MKIKFIKPSNAKNYFVIGVEKDGATEILTVSEAQYSSLGSPAVKDEIDEQLFARLSGYGEYNKAMKKALNILSFGDNSTKTLKMKLIRGGIKAELAGEISKEMLRLGYINERRQLETLIEREVNEGLSGPRKIIPKLIGKGYAADEIKTVFKMLVERGDINLDATKRKLIEKKLGSPCNDGEIKKILYKHGF